MRMKSSTHMQEFGYGCTYIPTCIYTHKEFNPAIYTQAVFPPLTGSGDSSVMASLRADVQLGMWDSQAGIPGTAESLGEECCIDRKVWIGKSRWLCVYALGLCVYVCVCHRLILSFR